MGKEKGKEDNKMVSDKVDRRTFMKSVGVAAGSVIVNDLINPLAYSAPALGARIDQIGIASGYTFRPSIEETRLILEQFRKLGLEARRSQAALLHSYLSSITTNLSISGFLAIHPLRNVMSHLLS